MSLSTRGTTGAVAARVSTALPCGRGEFAFGRAQRLLQTSGRADAQMVVSETARDRSGNPNSACGRRRRGCRDRNAARVVARGATIVWYRRGRVHARVTMLRRGRGRRSDRAYEGRETAPAAATPDMFLNENGSAERSAAWGRRIVCRRAGGDADARVAHGKHGRLPWTNCSLRQSSSRAGFAISPRLHSLLDGFKRFARGEKFRRHFYDDTGEPWPIGYRLINEGDTRQRCACSRREAAMRCTRASSRRDRRARFARIPCAPAG